MERKYRIAILGMGGVGGFIGGRLAAVHSKSKNIEILFIARGKNAEALKERGLTLVSSSGEITVGPDIVVDDVRGIGTIDLLICCTKSYDLENSIHSLSASLTTDTFILPLLNGIDATERVQSIMPQVKVLQGCIYIVSKLRSPAFVQQGGDFHSLHLGGDGIMPDKMHSLLYLFDKADINAFWEHNIHEKIWAKFSFISPVATYTSAHNITIGDILESREHSGAIEKLMFELSLLARKLNIGLADDFVEKNFNVMRKLPASATSSMQADFANGKPTELETLTGVVVRKAAEQGIQLDSYAGMYQSLSQRLLDAQAIDV